MKKLYDKKEILFAVLWIVAYCALTIPIRGNLGDESLQTILRDFELADGIRFKTLENNDGSGRKIMEVY